MKKQQNYPLLADLFNALESEGFLISMDMLLRVQSILESKGKEFKSNPENLKLILSPIIAKSDVEQKKFNRIFDFWISQIQSDNSPPTFPLTNTTTLKPAKVKLQTIIIVTIISAVFFLSAFIFSSYYFDKFQEFEQPKFKKTQPKDLKSDCPETEKPPSSFSVSNTQANVGDSISFTIGPEVEQLKENLLFYWYMGNGDSISTNQNTIIHSFQQPGVYLTFLVVSYKNTEYCFSLSQQYIQILHPDSKIPLPELAYLKPVLDPQPYTDQYNWLKALAGLLIYLISLVSLSSVWLWYKKLKQNVLETAKAILIQKSKEEELANAKGGTGAPFNLVFTSQNQHIEVVQEIYDVSNALRQRQLADIKRLDLNGTIYQTIRAGGLPKMSFRFLSIPTEYLVLIDHTNRNDHRAQLFESWIDTMAFENVHIVKFFFRHDPRICWNKEIPDGIPIESLFQKYHKHRLIVMSNADYLLEPYRSTLKEWVPVCFEGWEKKVLVTPVEPVEWSYQEKLLSQIFTVVPANKHGQFAIANLFSSDETIGYDKLKTHFSNSSISLPVPVYSNHSEDILDKDAFINYLTIYDDEGRANTDLYLLLCASAVYQPLTWEITLSIAKALADNGLIQKHTLAYENLLRLFNLPWMQEGKIPEEIRRQLESELQQNSVAELIVRQTIIQQLDSLNLPPNSLALRKKQQQLSIQHSATETALVNAQSNLNQKLFHKNSDSDYLFNQSTTIPGVKAIGEETDPVKANDILQKISNWFEKRFKENQDQRSDTLQLDLLVSQELKNRNQWVITLAQVKNGWMSIKQWSAINYLTFIVAFGLWASTLSLTSKVTANKENALLNNTGVKAFERNETDSALSLFNQAYLLDTSYYYARINLALINYRIGLNSYYTGETEAAISKFHNVAHLSSGSDMGLFALHHIGVLQFRIGAVDSAQIYYERIMSLDSNLYYRFIPNLSTLLGKKILDDQSFPPRQSAFTASIGEPRGMAFSIDDNFLLSGSKGNEAVLFTIPNLQPVYQLQGHSAPVWSFTFSPDMNFALTGSFDHKAMIWDVNQQYQNGFVFESHSDVILSTAFSPNSLVFATASIDKTAKLWDIESQKLLHTFNKHTTPVWAVAFSPDGTMLVTASADGQIYVWDVTTYSEITGFSQSEIGVMSIEFSPTGKILATGSNDGKIILRQIPSFEIVSTLTAEYSDGVSSLSFSPDGKLLIAGGAAIPISIYLYDNDKTEGDYIIGPNYQQTETDPVEGTVYLFDVEANRVQHTFGGAKAAFSNNGQFIAIAHNKHIELHYTGLYSNLQTDLCKNTKCGSNGNCNPNTGICECLNGYTGENCEIPPNGRNLCEGIDCGRNGNCVDGRCQCRNGYTGNRCQTPPAATNLCRNINCGENGYCNPQTGKCVCKNGYTGDKCQTPPPATNTQQNNSQSQQQEMIQNIKNSYKFDFVSSAFSERMLLVRNGGKWFYLNEQGNPAISGAYFDEAENFNNGRAKVKQYGYTFYIDKSGFCLDNCPNDPRVNNNQSGK